MKKGKLESKRIIEKYDAKQETDKENNKKVHNDKQHKLESSNADNYIKDSVDELLTQFGAMNKILQFISKMVIEVFGFSGNTMDWIELKNTTNLEDYVKAVVNSNQTTKPSRLIIAVDNDELLIVKDTLLTLFNVEAKEEVTKEKFEQKLRTYIQKAKLTETQKKETEKEEKEEQERIVEEKRIAEEEEERVAEEKRIAEEEAAKLAKEAKEVEVALQAKAVEDTKIAAADQYTNTDFGEAKGVEAMNFLKHYGLVGTEADGFGQVNGMKLSTPKLNNNIEETPAAEWFDFTEDASLHYDATLYYRIEKEQLKFLVVAVAEGPPDCIQPNENAYNSMELIEIQNYSRQNKTEGGTSIRPFITEILGQPAYSKVNKVYLSPLSHQLIGFYQSKWNMKLVGIDKWMVQDKTKMIEFLSSNKQVKRVIKKIAKEKPNNGDGTGQKTEVKSYELGNTTTNDERTATLNIENNLISTQPACFVDIPIKNEQTRHKLIESGWFPELLRY